MSSNPHIEGGEVRRSAAAPVLVNLQFLRGFSALLVVADHLLLRLVLRGALPSQYETLAFAMGNAGVAAFFAISGFIMVFTTAERFGLAGAPATFLWKRFFRIAPLYYVTTAAFIVMITVIKHEHVSLGDVARSLAFIPYRTGGPLFSPVYGVGWTLNYEMMFYAIFGLAMLLPYRTGITVIVVALAGLVAAGAIWPATQTAGLMAFFTAPILLNFVVGVLIGVVYRVRTFTPRFPAAGACAIAVGIIVVSFATPGILKTVVVSFAVITCVFLKPSDELGWFSKASKWIGDISFSVYLTHSFVLGAVASLLVKTRLDANWFWPLFVAVAALVCLGVGGIAYRWVERPLGKLSRGPRFQWARLRSVWVQDPHPALRVVEGADGTIGLAPRPLGADGDFRPGRPDGPGT